MHIAYDREKCQGHGRCYALAPELFDADDEGYSVVLVSGELSPEQVTQAQLAEIAKVKMPDLNTDDLEAAKLQIAGTARSMGIKVVD